MMHENLPKIRVILFGGAFVVAAMLVVIGTIVYHRHRQAHRLISSSMVQAAESRSTHAANTVPIKPFQAIHTAQGAANLVQSTYDEYLTAVHQASTRDGILPSLAGLTAVKNDLTSDLYAEATASPNGKAFSCAADFVPYKYTASSASGSTTSAVVAVQVSKSAGDAATSGMTATVDLYTLKITAVSCL